MESEDEMVGYHHWFNGDELEQGLGDGEGREAWHAAVQGGYKESDTTEWLNNNMESDRIGLCVSCIVRQFA